MPCGGVIESGERRGEQMNDELDIVGLRMELARATARVEALENERMRLTSLKDEAFTKLDAAVKWAEAAEKMLNEGWVDGWRERAIALVSKHAPKTKGPKLNHDETSLNLVSTRFCAKV